MMPFILFHPSIFLLSQCTLLIKIAASDSIDWAYRDPNNEYGARESPAVLVMLFGASPTSSKLNFVNFFFPRNIETPFSKITIARIAIV